ncbi:MAG TPA: XRE family transcriptional regulator [Desulfobacteraceae bacterium]|nr:XRE family transcriptional regulator [Desulfobacteraceae bacterium]
MMLSELGETIRRLRRETGLTQEEVAEKAGISRPTLSRLEQGRFANVSVRALFIILDILDYEIELTVKNSLGLPILKQDA